MRKLIFIIFLLIANISLGQKWLHGKVQVVDVFEDYKVKVVDVFEDLDVEKVDYWPDKEGQWQFVDNFPDFKIKFVDAFPDFTIKYVKYFPGLQNENLRENPSTTFPAPALTNQNLSNTNGYGILCTNKGTIYFFDVSGKYDDPNDPHSPYNHYLNKDKPENSSKHVDDRGIVYTKNKYSDGIGYSVKITPKDMDDYKIDTLNNMFYVKRTGEYLPFKAKVRILMAEEIEVPQLTVSINEYQAPNFSIKFVNHVPENDFQWQKVSEGEDFTIKFTTDYKQADVRVVDFAKELRFYR